MKMKHDLRSVVRHFHIHGNVLDAGRYGSGHINDTYCVMFDQGGRSIRYILQRINHNIFTNPVALMENIQRVTTHIGKKYADRSDQTRRVLTLIPACDGAMYYRDSEDNFWRAYIFIENAQTFDALQSPAQAFQAAKAFGEFQKLLVDLPEPPLHDTIPDFHNTLKRIAALEKAVQNDIKNRAILVKREIAFALRRKTIANVLIEANLPEHVTHNDTKINNVMIDDVTGQGICVIDLDTVMSGLALYDFGDMVRTMTSPTNEEERDLSKVTMKLTMFKALIQGYFSAAADFLTLAEKQLLPFSAKLITLETGIRFLTDFLEGDSYFKVHREGHNLDRCRAQFQLVESIEEQEEEMHQLIESFEPLERGMKLTVEAVK